VRGGPYPCLLLYQNTRPAVLLLEYKLDVMVYWCLHDRAPQYLADHLIPVSDAAPRRLRLRSANPNRLTVPRCRLSGFLSRWFDILELVARKT